MKSLLFIFIFFTFLNTFSQEGVHVNITNNTKFKLPDGKIINYKEYDKLTYNGDYSITTKNIKPGETPEFYPLKKNSKEEKKEILKWYKTPSDKMEGTLYKDEKGKIISYYEFKAATHSGKFIGGGKKDKETGVFFMQLRKPNERDKQRKIHDEWRKKVIGTPAPKFEIIDMEGNIISSENTKDKVVFLNFWFTTCAPCIREIPELNKIYQKYKDNSEVVFASVCRDNQERVTPFLKKHPIHMPISTVSKSNIDIFNVDGFPTNVIIDKKGNYKKHVYMITESFGTYIKEALNQK